jgi:predicted HTH transcriptional regulator
MTGMPFGNRPTERVEYAEIEGLIEDEVSEGRSIDYKREIGRADDDKREFLADVSSYATTAGGYMVVGMTETEGIASGIVGLSVNDVDQEILRLENLIRDGIQPRLAGVEIAVKAAEDQARRGVVLIGAGVEPERVHGGLAGSARFRTATALEEPASGAYNEGLAPAALVLRQ